MQHYIMLLLPFPWSWLCHGWQPSQEEDISYFWENSDLTEIIYLPQEMAPYSWTRQSWNNKFSRFARVGIIFIQGPRKCNSKFKSGTVWMFFLLYICIKTFLSIRERILAVGNHLVRKDGKVMIYKLFFKEKDRWELPVLPIEFVWQFLGKNKTMQKNKGKVKLSLSRSSWVEEENKTM